jgi:diguanylate cyclase (GGDEF)-like protein
MFLFVTTAGVLSLLHILFRRYGDEQRKSVERAQIADRERAELAEQHLTKLQGYVEQIEASAKELRQSQEKFRWAAYHDGLTNLPNRDRLVHEVKIELARGQAGDNYRFAFLILDLKNFKVVNESLSRPIGDRLIVDVGERLKSMVPRNATVGRTGGDEFALLLPSAGNDLEIVDFAKKVLESIAAPFEIGARQIYLAGTLGISVGTGGEEAEDVLRDAEMAMHRAKEKNRGFVMFERRMLTHAVSRLQLETDLRKAVERDEFEIFYQPIVDLRTKHIRGFEALVRWNHPTLGRMSPDKFIPIAEATGLIIPMTKQILSKACTQLVEWNGRSKNADALFASVNLSGTHFGHRGLVGHITSVLDKTGLDPRLLKLEITESVRHGKCRGSDLDA